MKKHVISGLVLAALAWQTAAAPQPATFSVVQQEAIGKIASEYLVAHPDFLVKASQRLQDEQQSAQQQTMRAAVMVHLPALLADKTTPVLGNPNGNITVVEFFDYQCAYCVKMAPLVDTLIKTHKNVRIMFKEFPIFGSRWPASTQAAATGLSVWQAQGAAAYQRYRQGIFDTGHNEGTLTQADISEVLGKAGLKTPTESQMNAALPALQKNVDLAEALGFSGTPAFVVLPSRQATLSQVTVIPGAAPLALFELAMAKASRAAP